MQRPAHDCRPTAADRHDRPRPAPPIDRCRRDFVALSVATGLGAAMHPAVGALAVAVREFAITTADGICDAAFFERATGYRTALA